MTLLIRVALSVNLMTCLLCSNILLIPCGVEFNSRLLNMLKIADFLSDDGHNVSILLPSTISGGLKNPNITLYEITVSPDTKMTSIKELLDFTDQLFSLNWKNVNDVLTSVEKPVCELMLNSSIPQRLKEAKFDLLVLDTFSICHKITAQIVNTTVVHYSNYGHFIDPYIFYPNMASMWCFPELAPLCTTQQPTFLNRFLRIIIPFFWKNFMLQAMVGEYEKLKIKYGFFINQTLPEVGMESLVISNLDFALDLPVPLMPHIIPISGVFRQEPVPLPEDLKNFVEGAGNEGFIIVSFGTMLDFQKVEIFIDVFSNLQQRVVWKYKGPPLKNLTSNVLTMSWLPQNDLLAHPAAKLFITHCGISSTYETVIHGVPVVAVPYNIDQPANAHKLVTRRKMGVWVDIKTMTREELGDAINEVLNNRTYTINAREAKALVNDHMVQPKEEFLYWIRYIIRHKGAKHLLNSYVHNMSFIDLWSLDVYFILFLTFIFIVVSTLLVLRGTCRFLGNQAKLYAAKRKLD